MKVSHTIHTFRLKMPKAMAKRVAREYYCSTRDFGGFGCYVLAIQPNGCEGQIRFDIISQELGAKLTKVIKQHK